MFWIVAVPLTSIYAFNIDIYLSLGVSLVISLSCSFVIVSELFCFERFENPVILLPILLSIKSQVDSADFRIIFFEVDLS